MDASFWHDRWAQNQLGFHQADVHPMLVKHLPALGLAPGARVFLPLCGKTLDIGWLLAQGYRVAGAELSEIAIRDLFAGLGVAPEIRQDGALKHFAADGLDIFVGDIFDLDTATLGAVDAVYDRAATVALPNEMRARYVPHLITLTARAPQLVISFDYDQTLLTPPPFSVPADAIRGLYGSAYTVKQVDDAPVEGGLKGLDSAREQVWLLS